MYFGLLCSIRQSINTYRYQLHRQKPSLLFDAQSSDFAFQEKKTLHSRGSKMLGNSDRNLPEDVVNEILSRLPVKSLLRFKCVCKYWCTLIKSPAFISKHFNQENNNARLLVHHYNSDIGRYPIALFPDETLAGIPPLREDLDDLQIPEPIPYFVGPIDGIFFLHSSGFSDGDHMALWNPAMREFRCLRVLGPIFPPHFRVVRDTFGFGLDPLTSDYKVIWIRCFFEDMDDDETLSHDSIPYPYFVAALYTLGNDSWRYFDLLTIPTNRVLQNSVCATCINGAYYWVASEDYKHWILSFDMSSEAFREIEGPDNSEETSASLSLYNDSIALFLYQYRDLAYDDLDLFLSQDHELLLSIIDIWVMEGEGCWTKLLTVKPFTKVSRPLGFWKNEELLFESSNNELVLYNHNTHEIRSLEIYGFGRFIGLFAFCYKESILSVMGQNEDHRGYELSDVVRDFFARGSSGSSS